MKKTFIFVEGVLLTIILFTIHSNVFANERNDESFDDQGLKASKFMPLNKPNLRVKIPQFKNGKLDCLIKADEMIRIDEENVRIQNMNIDFFLNRVLGVFWSNLGSGFEFCAKNAI